MEAGSTIPTFTSVQAARARGGGVCKSWTRPRGARRCGDHWKTVQSSSKTYASSSKPVSLRPAFLHVSRYRYFLPFANVLSSVHLLHLQAPFHICCLATRRWSVLCVSPSPSSCPILDVSGVNPGPDRTTLGREVGHTKRIERLVRFRMGRTDWKYNVSRGQRVSCMYSYPHKAREVRNLATCANSAPCMTLSKTTTPSPPTKPLAARSLLSGPPNCIIQTRFSPVDDPEFSIRGVEGEDSDRVSPWVIG